MKKKELEDTMRKLSVLVLMGRLREAQNIAKKYLEQDKPKTPEE